MAIAPPCRMQLLYTPLLLCALCGLCFVQQGLAQTPTPAGAQDQAQKPCTANCSTPRTSSTDVPVPVTGPAPSFPYPGEKTKSQAPAVPDAPESVPDSQAPSSKSTAPSKQFPYPGETKAPDSDTTGSSSSSSSEPSANADGSSDPSNTDDAANADKFPRRRLPKVRNLQTDDERVGEDLSVARYYFDRGNFNAAYLRSKDAVQHAADDPDAHLLLAEAAVKINKKDEAIAEYNTIFKLDSSDHQIKAARKALARLQ